MTKPIYNTQYYRKAMRIKHTILYIEQENETEKKFF